MIITCDACHYTFELKALPERCPDCGKLSATRPASPAEQAEYHKIRRELGYEKAASGE